MIMIIITEFAVVFPRGGSSSSFQIELEFRNVDFCGGRKTGEPGEKPLSFAEVQAFVISIRCAKCTAGAKSNGSIRRRTSARCMSISRTSLSFSRTSMDFSTLAKFDSLKLTETHC